MTEPGGTPTEHRSRAAEEKIVAAAEQLLGSRRLEDVSIDDVAEACGLQPAVVARYFPSVDRIAARLLRDFVVRLDAGAQWHSASADADYRALLEHQSRNVAGIYARHGAVIAALSEATDASPEVQALWADAVDNRVRLVADRLRALAEYGVIRPLDADLVASALVLMVHHTLVRIYRHRSDVEVEDAATAISTVWFHSVFPDETVAVA